MIIHWRTILISNWMENIRSLIKTVLFTRDTFLRFRLGGVNAAFLYTILWEAGMANQVHSRTNS